MDTKNNTGIENSGDYNSGNRNSGDYNIGNRNSGNRNSGNYNSGDRNSGIFNTNEPKMRSFNKECDLTYTEFRKKYGYKDLILPINSWIEARDMSDKKKKKVLGREQMGGYLKTLAYKEAWAKAWSETDEETKDWYKSLPNFDEKIFEEITGIKINEEVKELTVADIEKIVGCKVKIIKN